MKKKNRIILIIIAIIIVAFPLIFIGGEFVGADSQAEYIINSINPHYKPWFNGFSLELSPEMETFLFSFQAAVGAGVVGYILGYFKGKKNEKRVQ